jgi:hypothetical protein
MTKVVGGCFSLKARGSLGHAVCFQHNGNAEIIRVKPFVRYKKTFARTVQNSEFGECCADWRTADPDIKRYFIEQATGTEMSGFEMFMRSWFMKRFCDMYNYGIFGHSVYGMHREYEKYPDYLTGGV